MYYFSLHLLKLMKKALSISLLTLFVIATIGVTVRSHYCGGKLAGTSVYASASCGSCDNEMTSNCCNDESEFFQMDEDFVTTSANIDFSLNITFSLVSTYINFFIIEKNNSSDYLNYKPPLLSSDLPILIQSLLF